MNPTRSFQGEIVLLSAAFIWGTAFVFQSIAMDFMLPLTFVWIRSLISSIILFLIVFIRARMSPKRYSLASLGTFKGYQGALLAGLFTGLAMMAQQIGIVDSTAAKAGFFTTLYLLLVPILYSLFGKKVTLLQWFAIGIGLMGMFYLSTEGSLEDGLTSADIWLIACALLYACQIITIDFRGAFIDPILFTAIQFGFGFIITLIPSLFIEGFDGSFLMHQEALLSLLYVGGISGVIGYTLQIVGQNAFKNPTIASLLMSFEAVFALLMGFFVLGETLSWMEGLGAFLMLFAIMLTHLKPPQKVIAVKA